MSTSPLDPQGEVALNGDPPAPASRRGWGWGFAKWFVCWLTASAVLWFLIYQFVSPTYEAYAVLRAEPYQSVLDDPDSMSVEAVERYLSSQIQFINTDRVLNKALAHPSVAKLPVVRRSVDPLQTLRDRLKVLNMDNTFYIEIKFPSDDPAEAAAVVNAVASSYLGAYADYAEGMDHQLLRTLESYLGKLVNTRHELEAEQAKLAEKGRRPIVKSPDDDPASSSSFVTMTEELYRKAAERLIQADIDLVEAEAQATPSDARAEKLATLKKLRSELRQMLASHEPVDPAQPQVEALTRKLEVLSRRHDEVNQRYEGLKMKKEFLQVELLSPAAILKAPTRDPRAGLMLLASVVVLAVLGCIPAFRDHRRQ